MKKMTIRIAIRPATRLWWRNASPSVGLTVVLASSWIGNGSWPNWRIVTRFCASASG